MTNYDESNFKVKRHSQKVEFFSTENFWAKHIPIFFKGDLSIGVTKKHMNALYNTIKLFNVYTWE